MAILIDGTYHDEIVMARLRDGAAPYSSGSVVNSSG